MSNLRMRPVAADSFAMGGGDWEKRPDAMPRHEVTITRGFAISAEPVSFEDYSLFARETGRGGVYWDDRGFAVGMSWYQAAEYCAWLSEREGKPYRLPTEAEWEYCARNARAFGLDRVGDLYLREWCFDWYERYSDLPAIDPAGTKDGLFKAVRGGWLDSPLRYNEYPMDVWQRGALPPSYTCYPGDPNSFGKHSIGFRVVEGAQPEPRGEAPVFAVSRMARQQRPMDKGGAPEKPYFRKRRLFPAPPDNASNEEIRAMGLDAMLRHHNHSPGFAVLDNGDVMISIYSTYHEYDAEAGLMAARIRYGCDEWEQPEQFLNPVGVNDHAPLLWTDTADGTLWHFWGWQQLENSFPFQYCYSKDNGATWSEILFPCFSEQAERVVRQPVNTAFRAKDGYFYLVSDSSGGSCSVLWRTRDMLHWENPKGRTAGRHTTAVELLDGGILALGGKNSDIDGYMPQAVSYDRGDTWEVSRTDFPALTSGQRPCVIRLQSGMLFFCSDYQNKQGERPYPADDPRWGSYAAWSVDDGKTWRFKTLPGAQPSKKNSGLLGGASTLGYSVCRQAPDGMIHIVTTNTHPCLHLCFNEAWLLSDEPYEADIMRSGAASVAEAREFAEYYPDGSLRCVYHGGIADNGLFLLEGEEAWYYPGGALMSKASYHLGKRTGTYVFYREDGSRMWEWAYAPDGSAVYRTYYEDGAQRSHGRYLNRFAEGMAQTFSREGEVLSEVEFAGGKAIRVKDLRKEEPSPIGEVF